MNINKEKSIIPIFFIFLFIISLISVILSYFISKEKKSIVILNKNNPIVLSILKDKAIDTNNLNESSEIIKVFIDSEEEDLYDLSVDVNTKQALRTSNQSGQIFLTVINSEEEVIDKVDVTNMAGTIYEMKLSSKEPTKFIFTYIDYDGLYLEPNFRIK